MPGPGSSDAAVPTGARFFDGITGRARPVSLSVADDGLSVTAADGTVLRRWPLAALRRTDAGGAEWVLSVKGDAGRLVTADADTLDRLAARGARLSRPSAWDARRWLGVAAGIGASVAIAAVLIYRLPALITPFVPASIERGWGDGVESVLFASDRRCDRQSGMDALRDLVGRLARAAPLDRTPPVEVVDDGAINAFTLPGGRIVILRGLIDDARDPDELAGVLAHELGHVKHRDPTREMLRQMELGMLARSLGWGGRVGGDLAVLSFGRDAEAAADRSALTTLRAAGLRADGLSRFLTRMEASPDSGMPSFLSDHPGTALRADRLRTGPDGSHALSDAQWAAVRAVCGH